MAVDTGDGLTADEAAGHHEVPRERRRGAHRPRPPGPRLLPDAGSDPWVRSTSFTTRASTSATSATTRTPRRSRGPTTTPGANGDYQPVLAVEPVHPLLRTARTASGRIGWFPAHPHEGAVVANGPSRHGRARAAAAPAAGASTSPSRSTARRRPTAARWAVRSPNRHSTTSPTTTGISIAVHRHSSLSRPARRSARTHPGLAVFKDYVRNVAAWLHPVSGRRSSTVILIESIRYSPTRSDQHVTKPRPSCLMS